MSIKRHFKFWQWKSLKKQRLGRPKNKDKWGQYLEFYSLSFSSWLMIWLTLWPWRWTQYVPSRRRWTYREIHSAISLSVLILSSQTQWRQTSPRLCNLSKAKSIPFNCFTNERRQLRRLNVITDGTRVYVRTQRSFRNKQFRETRVHRFKADATTQIIPDCEGIKRIKTRTYNQGRN
jgi:hypothetical protein